METTDARTKKKRNRGTAFERSVEKSTSWGVVGWGVGGGGGGGGGGGVGQGRA